MSPRGPATGPGELLLAGLETLAGAVVVLDERLRIVAATPMAETLAGPLPAGVSAPRLLCGQSDQRPVAEALAAGRPVTASVSRPRAQGGERMLRIRTVPLRHGGGTGWLLLLDEEYADANAADAPVLFHGMWTRHPAMKRLFHLIEKVAPGEATVLVRGRNH